VEIIKLDGSEKKYLIKHKYFASIKPYRKENIYHQPNAGRNTFVSNPKDYRQEEAIFLKNVC
jgi:hypothetical protein